MTGYATDSATITVCWEFVWVNGGHKHEMKTVLLVCVYLVRETACSNQHRLVPGARGEVLTIVGEGAWVHHPRVTAELDDRLATSHIPKANGFVWRAGGHQRSIGVERASPHRAEMAQKRVDESHRATVDLRRAPSSQLSLQGTTNPV